MLTALYSLYIVVHVSEVKRRCFDSDIYIDIGILVFIKFRCNHFHFYFI